MYSYPPPKILSFLPLTMEINLSLSAKPAVAFLEGDASQDNMDQGPPIDASRPITRLWAGKAIKCLKLGELFCRLLEDVNVESNTYIRGLACEVSEGSLRVP